MCICTYAAWPYFDRLISGQADTFGDSILIGCLVVWISKSSMTLSEPASFISHGNSFQGTFIPDCHDFGNLFNDTHRATHR